MKPVKYHQQKPQEINAAKGKGTEAETGELATEGQLKEIEMLVAVKDFAPTRFVEALKHYEIETLKEITKAQAEDFIAILKKEADK